MLPAQSVQRLPAWRDRADRDLREIFGLPVRLIKDCAPAPSPAGATTATKPAPSRALNLALAQAPAPARAQPSSK
jgi:hypothetical protein